MRLGVLAPWLASLLLAGCAATDPYSGGRTKPDGPASARSGRHLPPGELSGTVPRDLRDPAPRRFPLAARTPEGTLRRAASFYGNWTSASAPRQLRRMAALSVGEARAQLRLAAAQAGADPQQRGVRSRARVEAEAVRGSGPRRRAVVVTREVVQAPDLPDQGARYHVTVAALERRGERWVISRWSVEP